MKKSVVLVVAILAAIPIFLWLTQSDFIYTGTITGLQTYDFSDMPEPPTPPGMEVPIVPGTPPNGNGGNGGNGGTTNGGGGYTGGGGGGSGGSSARYYLDQAASAQPQYSWAQMQQLNELQILELIYDSARRVAIIEKKLQILELFPAFESKIAQLGNIQAQIQSWQRTSIEMPAALENIEKMRRRTVFTMILTFLSLLLIVGLISAMMIHKKKIEVEDKKVIKNYLNNYLRTGYRLETLKMHLRSSGWDDKIIEESIHGLKGGI